MKNDYKNPIIYITALKSGLPVYYPQINKTIVAAEYCEDYLSPYPRNSESVNVVDTNPQATLFNFTTQPTLYITSYRWLAISGLSADFDKLVAIRCANLDSKSILSIILGEVNAELLQQIDYSYTYKDDWLSYTLELLKNAELLPSFLSWEEPSEPFICEKLAPLESNSEVKEVERAKLQLQPNIIADFIIFQEALLKKEHYAIIIGTPQEIPLIRIHSSCYTGDLLRSLSCDCFDQLHEAISTIAGSGGGIILYLNQEGRGIGLVNKIRTYRLQNEKNLDTFQANLHLGLSEDARSFQIAASILKNLSIIELDLITNNWQKKTELEASGLKVRQIVPTLHSRPPNENYLKIKLDRQNRQP